MKQVFLMHRRRTAGQAIDRGADPWRLARFHIGRTYPLPRPNQP